MRKQIARLAVLVSGSGTNLQALIDACAGNQLAAQIVVVVSNRAEAYALNRARKAGIPTVVLPVQKNQERRDYDAALAQAVQAYKPDWIILAGWMRLLTSAFLDVFPRRVINLHPALPGMFPGVHAIERAYEAYQRGTLHETGVMIHLVPDESVDCGPVLAKAVVPILPEDSLKSLEERIHDVEHHLLVQAIGSVISKQIIEK